MFVHFTISFFFFILRTFFSRYMMRHDDVASTEVGRHFDGMWPLGYRMFLSNTLRETTCNTYHERCLRLLTKQVHKLIYA